MRGLSLPETPPTRTPLSPSLAQALPIRPLTGNSGHETRNAGQTQAVEGPGRLVGKRSAQVSREGGRLTGAYRALFCGVPPPSTPPASIAVASSDFDKTAGKIQSAATKKANQTEDPVIPTAIPGNTKIPLSIPPILIAIAVGRVKVL